MCKPWVSFMIISFNLVFSYHAESDIEIGYARSRLLFVNGLLQGLMSLHNTSKQISVKMDSWHERMKSRSLEIVEEDLLKFSFGSVESIAFAVDTKPQKNGWICDSSDCNNASRSFHSIQVFQHASNTKTEWIRRHLNDMCHSNSMCHFLHIDFNQTDTVLVFRQLYGVEESIKIDESAMFWIRNGNVSNAKIDKSIPVDQRTRSRNSTFFFSRPGIGNEIAESSSEFEQMLSSMLQKAKEDVFELRPSLTETLNHGVELERQMWQIFFLCCSFPVQSIVVLTSKADWTARSFSLLARLLDAKVLYLSIPAAAMHPDRKDPGSTCWLGGALPEKFLAWARGLRTSRTIDILFVDFASAVQPPDDVLDVWEPLMSVNAVVVVRGTNRGSLCSCGSDCIDCFQRGLHAAQALAGVRFNGAELFDSGAFLLPKGWQVLHDPAACGLTILKKYVLPNIAAVDQHNAEAAAAAAVMASPADAEDAEDDGWLTPRCFCTNACVCEPAAKRTAEPPHTKEEVWRERLLPRAANVAAGIAHAHMPATMSDLDTSIFDFPVFVISSPLAVERRLQTQRVLTAAGFKSCEFPNYGGAEELDVEQLINDRVLDHSTIEMMRSTPWIGANWKRIVSLTLNHLHCVEIGLSSGSDLFGVFEDDLMMGASPQLTRTRLAATLAELPPAADLLYLEYCFEHCSRLDYNAQQRYIVRAGRPACAAAIILTRKGAEKVLRRMRRIFLALDNMYSELISTGELEAYLATPPIFYQDSYLSGSHKLGERGVQGVSHRPFSIVCIEQEDGRGLDLTVARTFTVDSMQAGPDRYGAIILATSDTFVDSEWRLEHRGRDLILEYATRLREGPAPHGSNGSTGGVLPPLLPVGSMDFEQGQTSSGLLLDIDEASACWPGVVGCDLYVMLKDREGNEVEVLTVKLKDSMFFEDAGPPVIPALS